MKQQLMTLLLGAASVFCSYWRYRTGCIGG